MKVLSYLVLSGLLTVTACSHHKKSCCGGKDQMSCAKEKCDKPSCNTKSKCADGSCSKPKQSEAGDCTGGSCSKKKS